MIDPRDLEYCREAIRHGSHSFHAASRLLPARVRDPALALYTFCRVADDEVDLTRDKRAAVEDLRQRLDLAYRGKPMNAPADRAVTTVIEATDLPRALPEALLEGLAWDAEGRRYDTLSGLRAYSARVASSVGVMMAVIMGVRDRDALARACDLGVGMQLTNIARDVGEDALEGRLFLPLEWLERAGIEPEAFLADPRPAEPIRKIVSDLLAEASACYRRSEAGIAALPPDCRPAIYAARFIYAAIGTRLRAQGHDPISRRARTGPGEKLALLGWSVCRAGASLVLPRSPFLYSDPLAETAFLVEAAAIAPAKDHWSDTLIDTLADLKAEDIRRAALTAAPRHE